MVRCFSEFGTSRLIETSKLPGSLIIHEWSNLDESCLLLTGVVPRTAECARELPNFLSVQVTNDCSGVTIRMINYNNLL